MSPSRLRELSKGSPPTAENADFIEEMYQRWLVDSVSVDAQWRAFFQGFDLAMCPRTCAAAHEAHLQSKVASLIFAYRSQVHLIAELDPLGNNLDHHPDLELQRFDLSEADLDKVFDTGHLSGPKRASLKDILGVLRETYCRSVGVEYLHIQDVRQRRWLQKEMEPVRNHPELGRDLKLEILELELVVLELGQLGRTHHHFASHHVGWVDFGVPLPQVNVQHPGDERPLEPRPQPF